MPHSSAHVIMAGSWQMSAAWQRLQKGIFMFSKFASRKSRSFCIVLSALFLPGTAPANEIQPNEIQHHQTRFDVRFGGVSVGQMTFSFDIDGASYNLDGRGNTKGLAEWFAPGKAVIRSSGEYEESGIVADKHHLSVTEGKKTAVLDMAFDKGQVSSVVLTPPKKSKRRPDKYVEILPDQLKGVVDPASTLVVPVAMDRAKDPKAVCDRTIRVYDGETRFDMKLTYKGNKPVKTEGYNGYAYVCGMQYIPVAGHRKKQENVERMAANRDMEIWLAPMNASNVFTAIRILVPTWLGTFSAEPTYFGPSKS